MTAPTTTPEQRQAGLAKAQEMRRSRADLLASVKAGNISPVDVITNPSYPARGLRVVQLLRAVPGHGPVKAEKLMNSTGISNTRRVGGLGVQQRAKLAEALT